MASFFALQHAMDEAFIALLPMTVQVGSVESVQEMLAAGADVNMTTEDEITPLYIAAGWGRAEVVQLLLQAGAEVNKAAQDGATPLYVAAEKGHVEVVKKLLKAGAEVDKTQQSGATPLYISARWGHTEVVQLLLQAGAEVNKAKQDGVSPLMIAAYGGHVEVVQQLLQAGAEVNKTTQDRATALSVAAQNGHVEVVQQLLKAGAEVNKAAQDGATPLYLAAQNGHVKVVQQLLKAGAEVDNTKQTGVTPLSIAAQNGRTEVVLKSGADVNKDGVSPLMIAAYGGHVEVVQQLLQAGAEVNKTTQNGGPALYVAAQNGHVEVVQQLLKGGAEVDKAAHDGVTPLFIAAQNGHVEVVQQLLKAGAEVDKTHQTGATCTPLCIAAENGRANVVQLLLKSGADVNKASQQQDANGAGATPLYQASQNGHVAVVEQLLKAGAEVNKARQDGATPLYQASQNGHVAVVEQLLKAGAEVNKARQDGAYPLLIAAEMGHVDVVRQLLRAGAEVNKAVQTGVTPLYIAAQNGHVEVVQQLLKVGAEEDKARQVTSPEGAYQDVTDLHIATINGHFEVALILILSSQRSINKKATMDVAKLTEEYKEVSPLHIASASGHLNIVSLLVSAGADITCTAMIKSKQSGQVKVLRSYDVAVIKGHNLIAYILWSANNGKTASQQTFPNELAAHRATIEARQQTEKDIIRKLITTVLREHVGRKWRELGRRLGITVAELDDIMRRCNQGGRKKMTVESLLLWLDRQPYWPNIFDVWWALENMQMADVAALVLSKVIDERNLAGVKDEPSDSALVPIEVEMGGPELRALYDRACAEGYTEVYSTRFVLIGKFGNGKTNLCSSLLGEEFDPEWKITDGIAIHPCVMTQEQQWRKLEGQEDHFPHTVAEVMKKLKDEKEDDETGSKSPTTSQHDSDVTDTTEPEAVTTMGSENKREVRPKPPTSTEDSHGQPALDVLDTTRTAPDVQETTPQPKVGEEQIDKTPPKTFMKAADIFSKQEESEDQSNVTGTKEYPLISIWDFGGQEIFYSTQQVFYSHRAIYGMVVDFTKPLDSPVEEMSTVGPTSHCRKEKDFIDYHLESMRAHTRPPLPHCETDQTPAARDIEPPVLVIFTKKDQLPQERKQQKFHSDTRNHLKGKVIDKHVIDRYFSVDNTKRNPEDPEVTELRKFIIDLARKQSYMGERVPVKWLELKSKLQDMHKQGKRYCTLQEVMEAIGSPPVATSPEENAINILKFWHLCGDIIFFPVQNLRNFVILDPQWFVDVCKTIITIPQYRDREVKEDWDKLQETGELQDHLIEHVWRHREEALQYNLIEHKQELLSMMEKFDLVLRCHGRSDEESGPKCVADEKAAYFVPSLLTTVTDEKKLYPPGTTRSKPIFIVFDGQFCPVGLYHRMVIGSMRRYFNVKPLAYASCARFITDNLRQTFVIRKEKFFLKIELVSSVRDEANRFSHGPNVRKGLEEDLREIIDNWAPGIKYKWCLKCSCEGHKGNEDVDRFFPIEDVSATEYFKSGEVVCKTYAPATATVQDVGLTDWFLNLLPQAGDEMLSAHPGGQTSVLQDCFHMVVKKVCPQWRELGLRLKLSSANVDEIEERHRGDPRKCCRAVCDRWVQLNGSNATVDVLKDALISIREVPTAEHIDDYLQQMSQGQPTQVQLQTGQGRGMLQNCFHMVVNEVCQRWREIGFRLKLSSANVDEIEERHRGDPRKCCRAVCDLWVQLNGSNATVDVLKDALISIREVPTAEYIDDYLQQMLQRQPTQVHLQAGQGRGSVDGWFAVIVEDVCPRWTELSRHLGLTEAQVDEIADTHSGDPRECCWEALKLWSRIQGRHASKERLRAALTSAEEIATVEKLDTLTQ